MSSGAPASGAGAGAGAGAGKGRRKSVTLNPIVRTVSGTEEAPLAGNEKRFGNGKAAFSSSTPYPPDKTFLGVPKSELWTTEANKQRAKQEVAIEKFFRTPWGGRRKQVTKHRRRNRKSHKKTYKKRN